MALFWAGLGAASASVRAIFHLAPDLFPLLAPGKGQTAGRTGFLRQIGFAAHFRHKALRTKTACEGPQTVVEMCQKSVGVATGCGLADAFIGRGP